MPAIGFVSCAEFCNILRADEGVEEPQANPIPTLKRGVVEQFACTFPVEIHDKAESEFQNPS